VSELFAAKPYLVAILAGATAQVIKVLSFLIVEKKVNYRRFVQPDGSPNMYISTMSALTMYVGFMDGFGTMTFALSLCLTLMIMVDTLNVKHAHSQQQEVVLILLDRWQPKHSAWVRSRKALSYTPMDVLSGTALGIVITLLVI
jgi:acid phosphatase family membrane protein YuiD